MQKKLSTVLAAGAVVMMVGCGEPAFDAAEATAKFGECLERNEVVYEDLDVELGTDGTLETLGVKILSEGDVAYEPVIRLACTAEVENLAADR